MRPSFRVSLVIFIVLSLALHLMFGAGGVVGEKVSQMRAQHEKDLARQAALDRQKAEEAKKAAEAKATVEATKKQIEADLKKQFETAFADKMKHDAAAQLWDQLLAKLMPDVDKYAAQVGDQRLSDEEVADDQNQLEGDLRKQLQEEGAKMLGDQFVERVKNEVAPRMADYYKDQIDRKIGNGIRDAGSRVINDDAATVRAQRISASQALTRAETQAHAAQTDLAQAKAHLDQQAPAAAAATTDAQKAAVAGAVKSDQTTIERAAGELQTAQKVLHDMTKGSDALPGALRKAIATAAANPATTQASQTAAAAATSIKAGKIPDAAKSANDAAAQAGQLADAIHAARTLADQETKDDPSASAQAKLAVRNVRDTDIKPELDQKFNDVVATKAVPRLGQELTDAFKNTLDQVGVSDDAVVKDVQAKVNAALAEKIKDDVDAGVAGTKPLTNAQKLDDVKADGTEGPDTGAPDQGNASGPRHHGPDNGGPANPNATTAPSDDTANDPHQKAVAAKIRKAADDIAGNGIDAIGNDTGDDKNLTAIATGGQNGRPGNNELSDLLSRIAQVGDNPGDHDGPDGGGPPQANQGDGSFSAGRLARLHQDSMQNSLAAHGGRLANAGFDNSSYDKIKITGRDPNVAQGQAVQLLGADGATADISTLVAQTKDEMMPATLAVRAAPKDATDGLIGIPEHKEPYRPAFKNICFTTIPYRSKPITLDGDLSEWADVKALPMYAAGPASKDHSVKAFPQEVKVQWDNTGFYICADVKKEDNKIIKTTNGHFWEGDGMEIFVDTANSKLKDRTAVSHQFWAWVDGAENTPLQVGGENVEYPGHDDYVPWGKDKIQVGSTQTPTGWRIEIHVPKERFRDLDLKAGRIIGMNFSICTGTPLYYYWAGTTEIATSQRPDTWGDAMLAGSDGRLECVDKLASELKPGETGKNQSFVKIGQPLRIRVTDPVMNLDDSKKDKISVSVTSPHGKAQEVILEETGDATGVFEGAIATAPEIGDPVPNAITLYDGEPVNITYIDQCRADGARDVKVKLSIPTASPLTALAHK